MNKGPVYIQRSTIHIWRSLQKELRREMKKRAYNWAHRREQRAQVLAATCVAMACVGVCWSRWHMLSTGYGNGHAWDLVNYLLPSWQLAAHLLAVGPLIIPIYGRSPSGHRGGLEATKARLPSRHFNPSRSQRPYHHLDTNGVREEIFAFITTEMPN